MSQREGERRFGMLSQKTALKSPTHVFCEENATYDFFSKLLQYSPFTTIVETLLVYFVICKYLATIIGHADDSTKGQPQRLVPLQWRDASNHLRDRT